MNENPYLAMLGNLSNVTPSTSVSSSGENPYLAMLGTLEGSSSDLVDPIELIHKYFPKSEWENAQKVMQAESGGKSDAVGDNYPIRGETIPSVGLFQIRTLPGRPPADQLKNPEFNVQYAAKMQKEQGWEPWTTARNMGLPGTTPL
jgi:hypothetical protein